MWLICSLIRIVLEFKESCSTSREVWDPTKPSPPPNRLKEKHNLPYLNQQRYWHSDRGTLQPQREPPVQFLERILVGRAT